MPGKLSVQVVSDVDDDVLAGLELYRSMAHPDLGPEVVRDWLYWFEENPFGRPSIALASLDGEIVGMHSLIPSRSSLGGKVIPSAKGEFFVVRPDCTLLKEPKSRLRLPLALPQESRHHAMTTGTVLTFGVSAKKALLSAQLSGAKTISWETLSFVAPLQLSGSSQGRLVRVPGIASALIFGRILRAIRRLQSKVASENFEVEEDDYFESVLPGADPPSNDLFANDAALVNFRFPSPYYRKYRLVRNGKTISQLVFTAPTRDSSVSLKFWSRFPASSRGLIEVLDRAIRDAKDEGGKWMRLEIPASNHLAARSLQRIGFIPRGRRNRLAQTWCPNQRLARTRDQGKWRFTSAYSGWYQLT